MSDSSLSRGWRQPRAWVLRAASQDSGGVRRIGALGGFCILLLAAALATGCRQDMHDQPRYEPLEATDFFADGRASRPLVEGTVPRGFLRDEPHLFTGKDGEDWAATFPFPVDEPLITRGRERYEIFCTPCHGRVGDGQGMAVLRGFPAAASFHDPRLRNERVGYYFDVITNGFGRMNDYAAQLRPRDRWAVIAYVRALQLSQHAPGEILDENDRQSIAAAAAGPGETTADRDSAPAADAAHGGGR